MFRILFSSILFFVTLVGSVNAHAVLPIDEKCEMEAENSDLVYSNIFSVVIDFDLAASSDLNKAMRWIYGGELKVIEWDRRSDNEIRAFVTFKSDVPSKKARKALQQLDQIDGVNAYCVSTAIKF